MSKEKTVVLFRVWKTDSKDVFALLPEVPGSCLRDYIGSSYEFNGHSAADLQLCIIKSRPAKPSEYKELKEQMERMGYELRIVNRISEKMHAKRRKAFKNV